MKNRMRQYLERWAAGLFAGLLIAALCVPAAAAGRPRVLRVAFPQVKGMSETAEDGTRHGLVVDYLNEIAKYTGWKYEYVDTTGEAMLDEFLNGAYELMGGSYYMPGLEEYYAYPDYNAGYSKAVLLARRDDYSVRSYDLESLNGKTIGVYERATENIRRLEAFLNINGLDCTIRPYSYEELSEDGNLYYHLENGEVDLLLGNGFEENGDLKVVVSYDSQPYYIVTNVGNQEVLDGLNMALEKITASNPNFGAEHYAANFPDSVFLDIQLTEAELAYVRERESVTVAVTENWHPLVCLSTQDDFHSGVVPDILQEIEDFSGLHFTYVFTDTYANAVRMVQKGEADMLGFFLGSEAEAAEKGLALTAAYECMNSIVVRNKSADYPDANAVGAIIQGTTLPSDIPASRTERYPTITDAISAVNRGEADFVYGLSARLEQDIQQNHFSNLVPVTLVNDQSDLSFALARPADANLLTILNKAINSMSDEKKTAILNQNLISLGTNQLTLSELIYSNPVTFIVVLSLALLALVTIVLWVNRTRVRAAVMESNLEKAKAESRAKGEFLSRMSHEIRTPMNAVVGLTDLTSMLDDVPPDVRENLTKIRASSQYLLSLINDILDMSRVDSGMLQIASEPFSLERTLQDMQSMMESEAQRRGLAYTLEKKITHSDLAGDAIRLRQVLTNLLSNAFKFTPAGGRVQLLVEETSCGAAGATLAFRVIDNGVGIQPADQERIFETFEQLGLNYSKSQGTGLGLPISRSIVQMMGGELRLQSEPGRGSEFSFTVTMPLSEPVKAAATEAVYPENGMLDGVRILLAEDNDLNAEIAGQLLARQGAEVCRAEDGRRTVERFADSEPGEYQAVLMDIQMPELNGLEAARAIRAMDRPDAAAIPIIAMTANSFQEDVDEAMAAGMNGFVSKPLDVDYLYRLLYDLLKRGREGGNAPR